MLKWSGESEQVVFHGQLTVTVLRANFFFQNFLRARIGIIEAGRRLVPRVPRVTMVDVRDVASVTVRALMDDRIAHRILEVTGADLIGTSDLLSYISFHSPSTIPWRELLLSEYEDELTRRGVATFRNKALLELFACASAPVFQVATTTIKAILGRSPRSCKEFVADHLQQLIATIH
jgi:hypothetical protein